MTSKLTEKEVEYKNKIKNIKSELVTKEREMREVLSNCKHVFVELSEKEVYTLQTAPWKASTRASIAGCLVCGMDFGWRCTESPDSTCHYFSESDGDSFYVILNDNTRHELREYDEDDYNYETNDNCIFCEWPEDRA